MGRIRGWPATLTEPDLLDAPVVLRPVRVCDVRDERRAQEANASWLRPWQPSAPGQAPVRSPIEPYVAMVRQSPIRPYLSVIRRRWNARWGSELLWAVRYGEHFAGQVTIWSFAWGPSRSAKVGYWIDKQFAGRGIIPTVLAMAVDYCFNVAALHRLEAGVRPENVASRRVVEKLGFRDEGTRVREVHIDGAWRDHVCYAITAEDVPGGMSVQWRSSFAASRSSRLAPSLGRLPSITAALPALLCTESMAMYPADRMGENVYDRRLTGQPVRGDEAGS